MTHRHGAAISCGTTSLIGKRICGTNDCSFIVRGGGAVSAVLLCFSPGGKVVKAVLVIPSVTV